MSELYKLHQQLEFLGDGVGIIFGALLIFGMYYFFYRLLVRVIKKGVKEALAESCVCKKKND